MRERKMQEKTKKKRALLNNEGLRKPTQFKRIHQQSVKCLRAVKNHRFAAHSSALVQATSDSNRKTDDTNTIWYIYVIRVLKS